MKAKGKTSNVAAAPVALVVGASGGVGEAVARLLCSEGYVVIATCRTAAQANRLLARGICHHTLLMSLDDGESVDQAFRKLDELDIPHIDGLVYCAGVTHANPLQKESMDELRALFEVNVFGALRVVQLSLPRLMAGHGRVVLIGSTSGGIGLPMLGAYSASKFALEGMSDALRRELAENGIAVSLVIPGGIKTPMTEKQLTAIQSDIATLNDGTEANYGKLYDRHQRLLKLVDATAIPPEEVASYVLKALKDTKPKPRYFCGVGQSLARTAFKLLPDTLWDELLPNVLDLASGNTLANIKNVELPFLWSSKAMNQMQQLSSFDALMLYGESHRTPMHVSPFFIYDMSTAPNGIVRFKDILRTFEQRLAQAPILRRKLVRVPFDLDEPYWADDPEFDIEQHVRHVALPKPGDRRQLQILLARLTAYPMDLDRPAWDAFVIEGLDNVNGVPAGSFGLLLRIHHAAIDGQSGHAVLRVLHDLMPKPPKVKMPARTKHASAPMPTTSEMLTRAYFHLMGKPSKMAKLMANALPATRRARSIKREHPDQERSAPTTRFSEKVTPHRVVILNNFDMEALRPVRQAVEGATLNDVIVSVVSGAMRRYLDAHGELPDQSLVTGMPINIRTEADKDAPGNVVSLTVLNMHSNIADPLERVHAIHASAVFTKAYHNAIGARIMSDIAESIPAGITALGTRAATAAGLMDKVPVNTVVTNVPGPQVPFYMCGAKVVEFQCVGIVLDGIGIFHSVNSYCGRIAVTVLADRHMMPDPDFYERCLRESYEAHIEAATDKSPAKKGARNRLADSKSLPVKPMKPMVTTKKKVSVQLKTRATPPPKRKPNGSSHRRASATA